MTESLWSCQEINIYNQQKGDDSYEENRKWAGLNPKQLIDEAEDDFKKPARERGAVKKRLLEYYKYLSTDYVYIRKPPTKKTTKKGREPSINTVSGVYISGSNRFYFH
jgi:hypothetical protein